MKQLLNTLYVMTQGAYLSLDHETVRVEVGGELKLQVPLHHLGSIVTMGNVMISPFFLGKCAEDGRAVVILDRNGRYKCRMVGKTNGNVLLRQAQYHAVQNGAITTSLAASVTAGKVKNARNVLMRSAREAATPEEEALLRKSADVQADALFHLKTPRDADHVRGLEGEAAAAYFDVFTLMMKPAERDSLAMNGRNRRPPLDPVNALISFLYTLLLNDCISALEGVGLDPQMGFLHVPRPGRPSLGLDLRPAASPPSPSAGSPSSWRPGGVYSVHPSVKGGIVYVDRSLLRCQYRDCQGAQKAAPRGSSVQKLWSARTEVGF